MAWLRMIVEGLRVGGIVACVAMAANTVATQLSHPLLSVEPDTTDAAEAALADGEPTKTAQRRARWADGLELRNIFCPSCEPEAPTPDPGPLDPDSEAQLPLSRSPLQLVATMDLGDRASMATLYDRDTHVVGIYRIHDPIRESIELVSIGPGYVVIQNEGRLERVAFGADTAPAPRPKKSTGKPPEPTSADRYEGRVQCSDEHTCQVDRALVDELFANPMVLAKELRASPHTVDGELAGFRLHGIRRGSLPKKLGLENGDAIVELGGQRLSSADELLTMAMKLRRASRVSATVLRKGKRIEKTLEVRD